MKTDFNIDPKQEELFKAMGMTDVEIQKFVVKFEGIINGAISSLAPSGWVATQVLEKMTDREILLMAAMHSVREVNEQVQRIVEEEKQDPLLRAKRAIHDFKQDPQDGIKKMLKDWNNDHNNGKTNT